MTNPASLVEIWRGPFLESQHFGHAVIVDGNGGLVRSWGDPDKIVLSRSSSKMIQALPLILSGAADRRALGTEQLALACASHQGASIHIDPVRRWLTALGLGADDLCCGPQSPRDRVERNRVIKADETPCKIHNNCSGKHAGFLTLKEHIGGDSNYVALDHPVQKAVRDIFEDVCQETSPGYGIDGCSAPNFATSLRAMGRAMGAFAGATEGGNATQQAMVRLREAMMLHPHLVAGETRACTDLMRAGAGRFVVKTGAEGFFIAIIPELAMGVALKIADGATRGAECAIAAILTSLKVLDPAHPLVKKWLNPTLYNFAGLETGEMKPSAELLA